MAKGKRIEISVNILLKRETGMSVAHCLELDLVAAAAGDAQAVKDLFDLIRAQVEYAFVNNNLDNLYHPAPAELWREYFLAKELPPAKRFKVSHIEDDTRSKIPPPWIISQIRAWDPCHAQ